MINLKIEKDCWIMATNGVGIFSRFEACAGAEIFWAGEDMFAIAADTEEDLLFKVFINPEEGETEYINKESPNYSGQGKLRSIYLSKPNPNLYEQRITGAENWVKTIRPDRDKTSHSPLATEAEIYQDKILGLSEAEIAEMNPDESGVTNSDEKEKPKRARDASGKFMKDDPSTPDYNEAWEGGVAP
jgi:hypothetical protein